MKGIIGAAMAPTGTPRPRSASMVLRRAAGLAVRGSSFTFSSLERVVTLTITLISPSPARSARRSASRRINPLLVTTLTGCLHSSATSSTVRVIRSRFSTG